MKLLINLVLLLGCLNPVHAQNSLKNLERVRLYGSDYVRLKEWAATAGFDVRWVTKKEEIRMTNQWWTFSFSVDSRKAKVNGVNLMLSLPFAVRNEVPFISKVDLQYTLQPLLRRSKSSASERVDTICLDAGHGGRDPGNVEKKYQEKKYTLLLCEQVAELLRNSGFKVVLTRSRDQFVDLVDRAVIANRSNADLFISIHYNAAAQSGVKGGEVYCLSPEGTSSSNSDRGKSDASAFPGNAQNEKNVLLAYHIQKSMLTNLLIEDRGIKRARFEVLRQVEMPAVLVEAGFMSNPTDAKNIYEATYRKKVAQAIIDGILGYKRAVEQ